MLKSKEFMPHIRIGTLYGICFNHSEPLFLKKYGKEDGKIICDDCKREVEPSRFEPLDPDEDVDAT